MKSWRETLISPDISMYDSMKLLNETAMQILVVVDQDNRLQGVITDGDIRRALVDGKTMECPVSEIMSTDPVCGTPDDSREMLFGRMRALTLHHMPVVDDTGVVVDLVLSDFKEPMLNPVIIMAGGMGKRLKPLTDDVPKPMLNVGNRPVLETIVNQLSEYGLGNIYISINYLGNQIEEYFGNGSKWGVDIKYIREEFPMGTAGALTLVNEKITCPLILMNGDLLTKLDFQKLVHYHESHNADMTICVREYSHTVPYGVLETDGVHLKSIREKPKQNSLVNAGIYVVNPEVKASIKSGTKIDITDVIDSLLADNRKITVFPIHEYWMDIGHPEDFDRAIYDFDINFRE